MKPREHRAKARKFAALMALGATSIDLAEPTSRPCSNCGETFVGKYMAELQQVCPSCVNAAVRFNEEDARHSRTEERRRHLATVGVEGKLLGMTFDTFKSDEQPLAFEESNNFVDQWPMLQGLALLGERGTGKTHLATAILHAVMEQGDDARYVYLPGLASDLAMAKDWQEAATKMFAPLYRAPLVVIDDAGRERKRDDSAFPQMMDTLLDRRSNGGYPTVITANMQKPELARWLGDAGASRFLSTARVIEMRPGDRRFSLPPSNPVPARLRDPLAACATCQGAGWLLDGKLRAGNPDRLMKCPVCDGRGY